MNGRNRTCPGCHKSYPPEMRYFSVQTATGRWRLHALCKECRDKEKAPCTRPRKPNNLPVTVRPPTPRERQEPYRFAYFLLARGGVADGLIKIGAAVHPLSRAKQIKKEYHADDVIILGLIPGAGDGGFKLEDELHNQFAYINTRVNTGAIGHTEWFEPAPELIAYIWLNAVQSPFLTRGWRLSRVFFDLALRLPAIDNVIPLALPAPATAAADESEVAA
jgi:hypothetical protein